MTDIQIDAGTLEASLNERTVTGLLIPYGEDGRSNLGKFSVASGAFSIPGDPSVVGFNKEHAREDVLGRATKVWESDKGVMGTFSIAEGAEGDTALLEIATGKRKHLSAEVANVVIKAGKAVSGRIFGAALVKTPAFPSATLLAAAADTDVEPLEPDDPDAQTTQEATAGPDGSTTTKVTTTKEVQNPDGSTTTTTTVTTVAVDAPTPDATDQPKEDAVSGIPNTLTASAKGASTKTGPSKAQFMALLSANLQGQASEQDRKALVSFAGPTQNTLFAALNDVKYDGAGGVTTGINVPQWIGEVWDGNAYTQKFLPLFNHADLSALTFSGYKWNVKPQGGDWAGNKAQIPSNAPSFTAISGTATRFAGGHDIARELKDLAFFGDTAFFDMYFSAMSESYARWADAKVLAAVLAGATALKADNPANLTIGAGLSAIIDGASAVIDEDATPTFALVETSLWKQIAKTPTQDTLGYLNASLNLTGQEGELDSFVIQPTSSLSAGQVLVGARDSATVFELPGAPIRAEALNIAQGGLDEGVFGYAGVLINKATSLQLVSPYTTGS